MLRLGWFSTGRGGGSRGLLSVVADAIQRGELDAEIAFVFCNREPGEHAGSDEYMTLVQSYGISLITHSSQRFRKEQGAPNFASVREAYDREVMVLLAEQAADLNVLAGYGLIFSPEMSRQHVSLNLHPATPDGPIGTWQQVIWELIEKEASQSGTMIHIATEDLDRGPPASYVSFPIHGQGYDGLWTEVAGQDVNALKEQHGEELPLLQHIRAEGLRRERPLLLETLKAFASGKLRVADRKVVDSNGTPTSPICLNDEVERALALTGDTA
jgi:folate-dependent phosphoribosylglycinamide formyltransferase PurN